MRVGLLDFDFSQPGQAWLGRKGHSQAQDAGQGQGRAVQGRATEQPQGTLHDTKSENGSISQGCSSDVFIDNNNFPNTQNTNLSQIFESHLPDFASGAECRCRAIHRHGRKYSLCHSSLYLYVQNRNQNFVNRCYGNHCCTFIFTKYNANDVFIDVCCLTSLRKCSDVFPGTLVW